MISIDDVSIDTRTNMTISYGVSINEETKLDLNFSIGSYGYEDMGSIGIEPAILAMLPRAMIEGHTIKSKFKADPVFLSNLGFYMRRMKLEPRTKEKMWMNYIQDFKKKLYEVKLDIEPKGFLGYSTQTRVGLFYSGGVDSLYSLITARDVEEVIHVENFNRNYQDSGRAITMLKKIRPDVALSLVKTNLNEPKPKNWDLISHGTYVAAIGHLFRDRFTRINISGTDTFRGSDSGTGPDINYLFSSSRVRFASYGDVYKTEKYKVLLEHPDRDFIMSNIQVCPLPRKVANCSKCPECLINMLMIDSLGASSLCKAFDFSGMRYRFEKIENDKHPYFYCMLPLVASEYRERGKHEMADLCLKTYERARQ